MFCIFLYCHWFVLPLWILLFWCSDSESLQYVVCVVQYLPNFTSKYWISVVYYVLSTLKQFFGNLDTVLCDIVFTMELERFTFNIVIFQSAWSAEESHFWRKSTHYRRKSICCHSRRNPTTWRYTINKQ